MKKSNTQKIKPKSYFAGILMIIPLLIGLVLFIGISDNKSIISLVLLVVPVLFAFYVLPLLKYSKAIKEYKYPNIIRLSFAIQIILGFTLIISGYHILVLTKPLSNSTYWLFLISLVSMILLDILRAVLDSFLSKNNNNKSNQGLLKNFLSLKSFVILFLFIFIAPYFESSSSFNLGLISTPIEIEALKLGVEPEEFKETDESIKDPQLIEEIFQQLKNQSVSNIIGIARSEYQRMADNIHSKYYLAPQYPQDERGRKIQYIVILNNGFVAIEEFRRDSSFLRNDTVLYKVQLEEQTIEKIISFVDNNISD